MQVRIIVETPDRGDVEVAKTLPDNLRMTELTDVQAIRKLILATTHQALLAYPGPVDGRDVTS